MNYHMAYEDYGFVMAPLYYEFVKWAQTVKEPNNPVYAAMRDGGPILTAAHEMAKLGITDTADWAELWVNTTVAANLDEDIIKEYLVQQGIEKEKPFTLVDSGFKGTIPRTFSHIHGYNVQSLLINGYLDKGYNFEQKVFTDRANHHISIKALEDGIPHRFTTFNSDFVKNNNIVKPKLYHSGYYEQHDYFNGGLKDGIAMCAQAETKKRRFFDFLELFRTKTKRFDKYLALLLNKERTCIFELPPDSRKKVERIYS